MVFHPNFDTFEELGRGQTTVVKRGWDRALGRPIAIKYLQEAFQNDERRKRDFLTQAQFLANLSHENVLNVYSLESKQGWIVMELMKGSMQDKLKEGPLSPDLVRSVMRQSLKALAYLHDQGRMHGKVRPSNILIDEEGRVKLSDFEIRGTEEEMPIPKGKEKYMAPELLRPEFGEVGKQLDLYCLGFTSLELLAGNRFNALFPGVGEHVADARASWIRWHSSEDELGPSTKLIRGIPADLGEAIDSLTRKRVADRPEDAHEALKLLSETPDLSVDLAPEYSTNATSSVPESSATGMQSSGRTAQPRRDPSSQQQRNQTQAARNPVVGNRRQQTSSPQPSNGLKLDLSDKRVFRVVACAVLLIAAVVGFWLQGMVNPSTKVAFAMKPERITVWESGKKLNPLNDSGNTYELSPGRHELVFRKEGYVESRQTLSVERDMDNIPVVLDPEPVKVTLMAEPKGVAVRNGEQQLAPIAPGKADYELVPGVYELVFEKEGFKPATRELTVTAGQPFSFSVSLEPNPIVVTLNLDPRDAEVWNGDKRLKPTEPNGNLYELPPGPQRLSFRKDGYPRHESILDIGQETTDFDISLPSGVNVQIIVDPGDSHILAENGMVLKPREHDPNTYLLPLGNQQLTVVREGFATTVVDVKVTEDISEPVRIDLTPMQEPATATQCDLRSDPPGATVVVDGKEVADQTPCLLTVEPGMHQLELKLPGFEPIEFETEVDKGVVRIFNERFETRRLSLAVTPADAYVEVNGAEWSGDDQAFFCPRDDELIVAASHTYFENIKRAFNPEQLDELRGRIVIALPQFTLPPGLTRMKDADDDTDLKLPFRVSIETFKNTSPLEFVLLKPGRTETGVDGPKYEGELPIAAFAMEQPCYLAVTETTNAQYEQFAEANSAIAGTEWKLYSGAGKESLPVLYVSHSSAVAFCNWLGGRLPTEQEWEYAARGPDNHGYPYPWGNEEIGPERCNLLFSQTPLAIAVDQLSLGATESGLFHMLGNAAEWCSDLYQAGYNEDPKELVVNASVQDGGITGEDADTTSESPDQSKLFTVRGCSFAKSVGPEVRVTWRAPEAEEGAKDVGFRVLIPIGSGGQAQ